jgi:hypothetical protein
MTAARLTSKNGFIIPPAGGIIQVQYTQFTGTNTYSITGDGSWAAITDLAVNITPVSTSSIIKIEAQVFGESSTSEYNQLFGFLRDSTELTAPSAGSRSVAIAQNLMGHWDENLSSTANGGHFAYFDSPASTSQITYKVMVTVNAAATFYLNRTLTDTDASSHERFVSFITVTEIAG